MKIPASAKAVGLAAAGVLVAGGLLFAFRNIEVVDNIRRGFDR